MSEPTGHAYSPETDALQRALERLLAKSAGISSPIARLERHDFQYGTSCPLEVLDVVFSDGSTLTLLLKDLSPKALNPDIRRIRPAFVFDPLREIEVYRVILPSGPPGPPRSFGSEVNEHDERFWLFLEKVEGRELYQFGELEIWSAAAKWIASFHCQFNSWDSLDRQVGQRLVRFDAAYYERWFERAEQFVNISATTEDRIVLSGLVKHAPKIIAELLAMPVSVIHGEYYASNVLVQDAGSGWRICPVDWERAAIAPGPIDIAALVAGNWTEEQKDLMAQQYCGEVSRIRGVRIDWNDFIRELCLCRLHLAIHWLGWSSDWTPPHEHRQNWLLEAHNMSKRLGYQADRRPPSFDAAADPP